MTNEYVNFVVGRNGLTEEQALKITQLAVMRQSFRLESEADNMQYWSVSYRPLSSEEEVESGVGTLRFITSDTIGYSVSYLPDSAVDLDDADYVCIARMQINVGREE